MAKSKSKQKVEASWKRKRWFQLLAPEVFNNQVIGESLVLEASELANRTVELSMMTLTGDIKKQNINVKFRVISTHDNKAQTEVIGYGLTTASLKRFVRRRRDRVDASFVCRTKDSRPIRLKPFIMTAHNASASVTSALRLKCIDFLIREVAKMPYKQVVREVVQGRLQGRMRDSLKKIYPLRSTAIRTLELVDSKNVRVIETVGGQERVNTEDTQPLVEEEETEELVEEVAEAAEEAPQESAEDLVEAPVEEVEEVKEEE